MLVTCDLPAVQEFNDWDLVHVTLCIHQASNICADEVQAAPGSLLRKMIGENLLCQVMKEGDCLQEEQVELSAIFQTQYQIGDFFTGFECECPGGNAELPKGTYWIPGCHQGEYRLDV